MNPPPHDSAARLGGHSAWRWMLFLAALMLLAPWVFSSPFSQAVLTQMGIAIVACLSYNMLLGQGGMLSFGHAVYTGWGLTWRCTCCKLRAVLGGRCRSA